ncbi:MAG: VCBS repeat-containing protein [Planctomycetes bacterium]|nr:VCBS repeat-containing protein [Planctomycetota bacterium]
MRHNRPKTKIALRLIPGLLAFAVMTVPSFASDWVDYTNETSARLVAPNSLGAGDTQEKDYAWGDVDKDGDIDLVVVRKQPFTTTGKRVNVLFMNEGGILVDRTTEYATDSDIPGDLGFNTPTNDRDIALVDVDGDGWLDMVTVVTLTDNQAKHLSHPRIYMNKGEIDGVWQGFKYEDARFPLLHPTAGPRFCSVGTGDVTGNGVPDLYFGDYDSGGTQIFDFNNRLLINDGNGFFTDESTLRMTGPMLLSAFGAASVIADINNDGVMDVVKQTALTAPQHIAVTYNDPSNEGYFFAYDTLNSFPSPYFVSVGDLNNDGRLDLVETDDGVDRYALNTGNGGDGLANWLVLSFPGTTGGFGGNSVIADLDNDGWNDVFITDVDVDIFGCSRISDVLRNNANPPNVTFTNDVANLPTSTLTGIHDIAIFDLNGDGWLDMVIGKCNGTQIWMSNPPFSVQFVYPEGRPETASPTNGATFPVEIIPIGDLLATDTPTVHVSINGGDFVSSPLTDLGEGLYEVALPAADCLDKLSYYITAELSSGAEFSDPVGAPADTFETVAAEGTFELFADQMEGDVSGWSVESARTLSTGEWEPAIPNGTTQDGQIIAPSSDATPGEGNVTAFVTENGLPGGGAGEADVDGGPTYLMSPVLDLEGTDGTVQYAHWFKSWINPDVFTVDVSNDAGETWTPVAVIQGTIAWDIGSFIVGDYVEPTSQVMVRFGTDDTPSNSYTEAGVDDFVVTALDCGDVPVEIVSSDPPNNARDARQPFEPDGSNPDGWSSLQLTFSGAADGLSADDFVVTHTGVGEPPTVTDVTADGNTATIELSGSIETLAWTTIMHAASGTSTRMGYLPADVNEDGVSTANDVLTLIDALNGVVELPMYKADIDRSGAANASDVLRVIDLLNGAGAYPEYLGASLPE